MGTVPRRKGDVERIAREHNYFERPPEEHSCHKLENEVAVSTLAPICLFIIITEMKINVIYVILINSNMLFVSMQPAIHKQTSKLL